MDDLVLLNVALTGNPINTKAKVNEIFVKSRDFIVGEESGQEELKEKSEDNSLLDNRIIKQEVKMPEEEKQETQKVEEAQKQETSQEESKEEAPKEENNEVSEGREVEGKSNTMLRQELDSLKKELVEIKSLLEKPIQKGKVSERKEAEIKASPEVGLLDMIA